MASGITQCSVERQDLNLCGELTTAGSEMPQSKGDRGAGAGVVGWAPGRQPHGRLFHCPGKEGGRGGRGCEWGVGQVAGSGGRAPSGGFCFLWGHRRPAHLQGHLGRWGQGGDQGGQGAQVNLAVRNVSSRLVSSGFLSLWQRKSRCTQDSAWRRGGGHAETEGGGAGRGGEGRALGRGSMRRLREQGQCVSRWKNRQGRATHSSGSPGGCGQEWDVGFCGFRGGALQRGGRQGCDHGNEERGRGLWPQAAWGPV